LLVRLFRFPSKKQKFILCIAETHAFSTFLQTLYHVFNCFLDCLDPWFAQVTKIAGVYHGCKQDLGARDRDETETFDFLPEIRPRRDPPKSLRDRDETETFRGRDRDLFSRPFRLTVGLYYNNRCIHYTDNMRQLH
jgi:hypothetical protein